jgi:hypothetical protein
VVLTLSGYKLNPNLVVDHIDGDPSNNKLSNLREITPADNSRNQSMRYDNTTGITGVNRHYMGKDEYFVAVWHEDGKQYRKAFNIRKLGKNLAFEMAVKFREDKLLKLKLDGVNFSNQHGRKINE